MFLTRTVPASVPSLFQSWRPWTSSFAVKNKVPSTLVNCWGTIHTSGPQSRWGKGPVGDTHLMPGKTQRIPQHAS